MIPFWKKTGTHSKPQSAQKRRQNTKPAVPRTAQQSRFLRPKIRPYKTNNYYALLMKGGVTHDPVLEKDR